ncbi:MAG: hypothetical protein P4L99_17950 [Chthoniobacter sp.]|nr:hypothetical protein [Chthoniobacter sp.]
MKTQLPLAAARLLGELTTNLALGQYTEMERRSHGIRLTAGQLRKAVDDYGRELIKLPEEAWKLTDTVLVRDSVPARYSVRQPLWTREEGRSDLSLELTLIEIAADRFEVEIDNLLVLLERLLSRSDTCR